MINFDGICYNELSEVPSSQLGNLTSIPIHSHELIYSNGKIPFLESHYFSIMSTLRRFRVNIPLSYTIDFFQNQINDLLIEKKKKNAYTLFLLKFYKKEFSSKLNPNCDIVFFIEIKKPNFLNKKINVTIYKDNLIFADSYSNMLQTNSSLRELAEVFAFENSYGASLILNNEKKVVESTRGSIFIIQDGQIITPPLISGSVDSVSRREIININNKKNDKKILEHEIPVFNIQRASELFLFSFTHGFTFVKSFRKKIFSSDESIKIKQIFFEYIKN